MLYLIFERWQEIPPTLYIIFFFLSTFAIQPQDFWVPIAIKTSSTFYCPRDDVTVYYSVGGRWVSFAVAFVETLSVYTSISWISLQYRLGGLMFILTSENGNGRIFSVSYRTIERIGICEWTVYTQNSMQLCLLRNCYTYVILFETNDCSCTYPRGFTIIRIIININ